jgi:hypothetical protein
MLPMGVHGGIQTPCQKALQALASKGLIYGLRVSGMQGATMHELPLRGTTQTQRHNGHDAYTRLGMDTWSRSGQLAKLVSRGPTGSHPSVTKNMPKDVPNKFAHENLGISK